MAEDEAVASCVAEDEVVASGSPVLLGRASREEEQLKASMAVDTTLSAGPPDAKVARPPATIAAVPMSAATASPQQAPVTTATRATQAPVTTATKATRPPLAKVQLVVSPIGPWFPQLQAYHTSVLINDVEFSFTADGIVQGRGAESHFMVARSNLETRTIDMGMHEVDVEAFYERLSPYFRCGTYDLLRKNCNSFSDVALFYLTKRRLDRSYRMLDLLGHTADKYTLIVQSMSRGYYVPNPYAKDFELSSVIHDLAQERSVCCCLSWFGGGLVYHRAASCN